MKVSNTEESTDSPADDLTFAVTWETVASSDTGISGGPFRFLSGLAEESWSSMPVSWCLAVTDNGEYSLYPISHQQPSWIYLMPKPITLQEGNMLSSL